MSTPAEQPWSPEPELLEAPPRRLRPSEYGELNAPNVMVYSALGGVLLVLGLVLAVVGFSGSNVLLILLGVVLLAAGAFSLTLPASRAKQARERAERLVRDGQPVMARIVTSNNLTGESMHGRAISYMLTLPGGEVVRREVNADDRALPKQIPGNATALIDPANTNDVELYAALPLRAVARAEPAPDPLAAAVPQAAPAAPQMGTVEENKPPAEPATQQQTQQNKPGYQGLPWE